ncbi:phosphate-starvation-inducible protein PsiE [Staphylococcus xylosus]|uniref:phosphate-starvation-inducible protein PsiE n=3 Tax=Staphylococcus xylosus TaxID=1288 RepID=UPI0009C0C57A|nr:phosphate-starvation-inducible PsiE family protein [Staphylococcus xylosus]ARD73942.1 phosphate-starvation-inducible protein PsiE [Staphylococcus xylosus]MBO3075465.1 phosphate-starvation-inducible PsiE family protein [Staphylococcus xylosus]MBV5140165.1 phosphate-starvation-inducible PsiE family protein [Staphylococcus xylosus]MBW3124638.1 phosphate-starvation-inducible PsiE family protein [Staphylococcus xylosus]MCR1813579.1 phosphate-starvation-inducible PsiE family protein [Staphylococc
MVNNKKNAAEIFSMFLMLILNMFIATIALILVIFLFKECISMINEIFISNSNVQYDYMIEKLLISFLYIEFILLIVQYFKKNYHFSMQYFIYAAITAIVRYIIVDHHSGSTTIGLAIAIIVLVFSLYFLKRFSLD